MNCNKSCVKKDNFHKNMMLEPYYHLLQFRTKNVIAKILLAFNHWLEVSQEKIDLIEETVEMLLNAGILLDDIQDDSKSRRGHQTAHTVFGTPTTINSVIYVTFLALQKVVDSKEPEVAKIFCEQMLVMCEGQHKEMYYRDEFICPTEEEYIQLCKEKTGGMIMLAVKLTQLFSKNKNDFTNLVNLLGVYCQICNDYLNFNTHENDQNDYCEDITEGKFSLPVIHAIKSQPNEKQVASILKKKTKDVEMKKYCVMLMEKYGSFEYTRKKMLEIETEIYMEVRKFGGNPFVDQILTKLNTIKL